MYDQHLVDSYKDHSAYIQDLFIKGFVEYWILKLSKENIVFCNDKVLYYYDEKHTEFLKFLPLITDLFDQLEESLKKYYNNAASCDYNYIIAQKQITEITEQLSKMHIFFSYYNNALLYIRRVLYEHFCEMVEYRFVIYLQNHVPKNCSINLQHLEDFHLEDKKFFSNLFRPIIQLLKNASNSKISYKDEDKIDEKLNGLWNYFRYISHCTEKLNESTKEEDLEKYQRKNYIEYLEKYNSNKPILYKLKCISDTFTDYFSIFSNMQNYYPGAADFHPYALVLSNCNFQISLIIESCTYYSAHQTLYKIIIDYIRRKQPGQVALMDRVPQDFTDDIYRRIKDSIDADDDTKSETINDLFTIQKNSRK